MKHFRAFLAAWLFGVAAPAFAYSPPFNSFSISGLGGSCSAAYTLVYQGANRQTICLAPGTAGYFLATGGSGAPPSWVNPAAGGTVTSVGLALPGIFSVSGTPVTTAGTLTGALVSQSANTFLAAPSGAAGIPAFRGLTNPDLPVPLVINDTSTYSKGSLVVSAPSDALGANIRLVSSGPTPSKTLIVSNGRFVISNDAYTADIFSLDDLGNAQFAQPLGVATGGTGATTASGTALDNITGFSGTGLMRRSGAGAYSFGSTVGVSEGGTGASTASGTALDNITGFSGTGVMSRTGAGAYSFSTIPALLGSQTANTIFAAPNGSAGNPAFRPLACADLPPASRCLLASGTVSNSATLTNTSVFSSAYKFYDIEIYNLVPVTTGTKFLLNLYLGGTLYTVAEHVYTCTTNTGAGNGYQSSNTDTGFIINHSPYAGATWPGRSEIHITADGVSRPAIMTAHMENDTSVATGAGLTRCAGSYQVAPSPLNITGFQAAYSTGNISTATYEIYGHN